LLKVRKLETSVLGQVQRRKEKDLRGVLQGRVNYWRGGGL